MIGYSAALDRALEMSARAHRAQMRKGSDVPYVQHPVHVAIILLKHGLPEEVVIAGLLHDVVEDCGVAPSEILAAFGDAVTALVAGVTEQKTETSDAAAAEQARERPWRVRKEEQLVHLTHASPHGAALKAADALHNCQSTLRDLERQGPSTWTRFNAPPHDQVWYYGSIAALVRDRLGDHPLTRELEAAVARLATYAPPV
jgi:(p)ppGpp synthase/HD superfamily hydrolase